MSAEAEEHHGDLLTFDDGTKAGLQMTRWEYLMDLFFIDLPDTYTVTPYADRTDIVASPVDDEDVEAAEMFEDCPEEDQDEDEMLECYEIDF